MRFQQAISDKIGLFFASLFPLQSFITILLRLRFFPLRGRAYTVLLHIGYTYSLGDTRNPRALLVFISITLVLFQYFEPPFEYNEKALRRRSICGIHSTFCNEESTLARNLNIFYTLFSTWKAGKETKQSNSFRGEELVFAIGSRRSFPSS